MTAPFSSNVIPNWEELVSCIMRQGTPSRVHPIELFLDAEVQTELCSSFGLLDGLSIDEPYFEQEKQICLMRFLGYDYVRCGLENTSFVLSHSVAYDTAPLARQTGRSFINEQRGPITTWAEFENYAWPDPNLATTHALEWYEQHLPDDMCVIASGGFAHFAEYLTWLMGYETLCYALYDQRDLVKAISDKLITFYHHMVKRLAQFSRVKFVWGSDDMAYKTGTLISPADLREFVLPGHRLMAEVSHAAGQPYLLHSCGKLTAIMSDLIDDVRIDGRHSFEDTIETVINAKQTYGQRIAVLGGIDVDFLCRASASEVRSRVAQTLEMCMPGGGYCLGTGNSVANYIPLDNYLAMLDEGRSWRKRT